MRCVVYTRVERVVYVVGLPGTSNPLAEALVGEAVRRLRGQSTDKGFCSMSDSRVLYCERVGNVPVHMDAKAMIEKAAARAGVLNVVYAELEVT